MPFDHRLGLGPVDLELLAASSGLAFDFSEPLATGLLDDMSPLQSGLDLAESLMQGSRQIAQQHPDYSMPPLKAERFEGWFPPRNKAAAISSTSEPLMPGDAAWTGSHPGEEASPTAAPETEPARAKTKEELRAYKLREKNKRAQSKYRARRRERHQEAQDHARELSEQLQKMALEKSALQEANIQLERAVVKNATAAWQNPPSASDQHARLIFTPSRDWTGYSAQNGILLTEVVSPPRALTDSEVKKMSLRDHAKLWKEYILKISQLTLVAADDRECPLPDQEPAAGMRRLAVLLRERQGFLAYLGVANPAMCHQIWRAELTDPPVAAAQPVPAEEWARIARTLDLSDAQAATLIQARRDYMLTLGRLLADRRTTQSQLYDAHLNEEHYELEDRGMVHLQLRGLVRKLQANLDEVHCAHCIFIVNVWKVFNPIQEARLLVQSFPRSPHLPVLIRELARERGQLNDAAIAQATAAPPPADDARSEGSSDDSRDTEEHLGVRLVNRIADKGMLGQFKYAI